MCPMGQGNGFCPSQSIITKNRRNSQRSSSDYCILTRLKEYIDQLLLTIDLDQEMT